MRINFTDIGRCLVCLKNPCQCQKEYKYKEDVYGNCYTCGRSMLETPLKKELEDFANWLHKKGYIDADYYAEEPKAIDAYLAHRAKI